MLNNIGNVYKAEGENQKALDYYQRSLPIYRRLKLQGGKAIVLNNMGSAYAQMGEYQTALEYHQQSGAIRKAIGDHAGESSSLNLAGVAWRKLGDMDKAIESLRSALEIRRHFDPIGEAETLLNIAAVARDRGDLTESRTRIEAALTITESLRAKIPDASLRASYVVRVQETYASYVDLLMRLHEQSPAAGYDAAALHAAERTRARVLLESLVEAQIRTSSPRYAALTQPEPLTAAQIQQNVL